MANDKQTFNFKEVAEKTKQHMDGRFDKLDGIIKDALKNGTAEGSVQINFKSSGEDKVVRSMKKIEKAAKKTGETVSEVVSVIDTFNKKGVGPASNKSAKTWFGSVEQITTAIKQQFKELETATDKSKVERNIYNLGNAMQALAGDISSLPDDIQKFWTSLDQRKKSNDFNGITVTVEQMKEAFAQLSSLSETDLGKINKLGDNISTILKNVEKQVNGGKTRIDPQPLLNVDEIIDFDKLDEAQRELKKRLKSVSDTVVKVDGGTIQIANDNLEELKNNMVALTDQLDVVKAKMAQIKKENKSKESFMSWIPDDEYKQKKAKSFFDNVKSAVSKKDVKSIYDEYEKFFAQDDKWEIGPDIRTAANKVLKDLTGFSVGTKKGFDKAMEALNPEMFAERQSEVSKRLLDEQKAIFDDLTKGMADASAEMPENLKEYFQELRNQIEATEGSGKRMFDLFKKRQDDLNLTFDKQSSKWKQKPVITKTKKTYNEQKRGDGSTKITSETTSTAGDRPAGTGENAIPPGTSGEIDTTAQTADRATDSVKSLSKALEFLGKIFEEVGGDQDKFIKKLQELNISKKELADLVNIAGFTDEQLGANDSTKIAMRRMLAEGIAKTKSGDAAVIGKQSNQEQLRQYIIDNSKEGEAENNLRKYSKAIVAVTDDAESLSAAMLKVQKGMGIDIVDNGEIQEDIQKLNELKQSLAEAESKLSELKAELEALNKVDQKTRIDYRDASAKADTKEFIETRTKKRVPGPHKADGTYDIDWLYKNAEKKMNEKDHVKAAAYYDKYFKAYQKQVGGVPKALGSNEYTLQLLDLAKMLNKIIDPVENQDFKKQIEDQEKLVADINEKIKAIEEKQAKQEKPKAAQKQRQRKSTQSSEQKELNEEKANEPDTTAQSESETKARKKEKESVESLKAALEALRQEKEKYISGAGGGLDSMTKAALSNSRGESPDNTKMSSDYAERVRKSLESGDFDRAAAYYEGYRTTTMRNKDSRERFFDVNGEDVTDRLAERAKAMTKYAIQVENKQGEIYKKIIEYDRKLTDLEQKLEKAKLQEEKASEPKVRNVDDKEKLINNVRQRVTTWTKPENAEKLTTQEAVDDYAKKIQTGILYMEQLGGNFEGLKKKYEEFKKSLKIQPNEIGLDKLKEQIEKDGKTIEQAYEENIQRKSKKASQEKQEEQKQKKKQEPKTAPSEEKPKAEPKAEPKQEQKPKTTPKKPETSGDLEEEINKANDLKDVLEKEIPAAIDKKNEAFTGEKNHVDSIIDAEINKVRELAQVIKEEIPKSFEEQFQKIDELRESLDKIFNISREEAAPEVPSLEKPIEEAKELKTGFENASEELVKLMKDLYLFNLQNSKNGKMYEAQAVFGTDNGYASELFKSSTSGFAKGRIQAKGSGANSAIHNHPEGVGVNPGAFSDGDLIIAIKDKLDGIVNQYIVTLDKIYHLDFSNVSEDQMNKLVDEYKKAANSIFEKIKDNLSINENTVGEFIDSDYRPLASSVDVIKNGFSTIVKETLEKYGQYINVDLKEDIINSNKSLLNNDVITNSTFDQLSDSIKKNIEESLSGTSMPANIQNEILSFINNAIVKYVEDITVKGFAGRYNTEALQQAIKNTGLDPNIFRTYSTKDIFSSMGIDITKYLKPLGINTDAMFGSTSQQQNETQQEFKETGDAAASAGETVRRSQEEIQKEINETNALLEQQERKLRQVEEASHKGAYAVVDPGGRKHAKDDLEKKYNELQNFKNENEYNLNDNEYLRKYYGKLNDYNMAYEKAVETGVAKNTIDRYFDHQALEDYFNILHKRYLAWQASIDETKKKLAELNQELLDVQNNSPAPEPQSKSNPALDEAKEKAKKDIEETSEYIKRLLDDIKFGDSEGIIYKYLVGENGIKDEKQLLDEVSQEISRINQKINEEIQQGKTRTEEEYMQAYEEVFRKMYAAQNLGLMDYKYKGTMTTEGLYDKWKSQDNNKWKNSFGNLDDDTFSRYGSLIANQKALNTMQQNGGEDYIKYLMREKELLEEIGTIMKKYQGDSKLDTSTLDVTQDEANDMAAQVLQEKEAIDQLVAKINEFNTANTQFTENNGLIEFSKLSTHALEALSDTLDDNIYKLNHYSEDVARRQSDVFENAIGGKIVDTNAPETLTNEYNTLWDKVSNGAMKAEEAIRQFNQTAQEMGYTFNESTNLWEKLESAPSETREQTENATRSVEELREEIQRTTNEIDELQENLYHMDNLISGNGVGAINGTRRNAQLASAYNAVKDYTGDDQEKRDELLLDFKRKWAYANEKGSATSVLGKYANPVSGDEIKDAFLRMKKRYEDGIKDLESKKTTLLKLQNELDAAMTAKENPADTSEQTGEQMEQDQREVQEEIEKTKRSIEELTEAYKKLLNVFNEAGGGTDAKNALIKSLSGEKFNLEELQRLASEITGASMDDLTGLTKKDLSTKIANQAQMNLLASTPAAQPEVSAEANKANEEYEELQKNIAQVRTEIETLKQSLSSLDEKFMLDSEADVFTQLVRMLEKVIPDAIEVKNGAFRDEVKVVEGVVEQEKEALGELEKAIRHVVEAINFKNVGLEDISQITNVLQILVKALKPKPLEDFSTNLNTLIEQFKKFNKEVNVGEGTIFSSLQDILGRADELRDFANILDHTQEQINNAADAASGNTGSWKIVDIPLLDKNKWDNIINSANNLHDIVGDVVRITQQIRTNSRTGEQNISYRIAGDKADATVGANGHVLNTTANVYDREFNAQQDARLRVLSTLESELVESGQMTDDLRSRVNNLFDVLSEANPHSKFKDYDRQLDEFRKSLQEADEEANRFQRNWDAWLAVINRRSGEQMRSDFANAIDRLGPGQEDRFADYHDENGNWTGALQSVPFDNLLNKYKELEKQQNEYNKVLQQSFSSEHPEQYNEALNDILITIERIKGELRDEVSESLLDSFNEKQLDELKNQLNKNDIAEARGNDIVANYKKKQDEKQAKDDKEASNKLEQQWKKAQAAIESYYKAAKRVKEIQDAIDAGERDENKYSTKMALSKARDQMQRAKNRTIGVVDKDAIRDEQSKADYAEANRIFSLYGSENIDPLSQGFSRLENAANVYAKLTKEAEKYYKLIYKKQSGKTLSYNEKQYLEQMIPLYEKINKEADKYNDHLTEEERAKLPQDFKQAVVDARSKPLLDEYENIRQGIDSLGNMERNSNLDKYLNYLEIKYENLGKEISKIDWDGNSEAAEQNIKNVADRVINFSNQIAKASKSNDFVTIDDNDKAPLKRRMAEWSQQNQAAKDAIVQIQKLQTKLENIDDKGSLDKIEAEFENIKRKANEAGDVGKSFAQKLKGSFGNLARYLMSFAGFYEFVNVLRQGVAVVREMDTGLTEMRKVSEESLNTLKNYQFETFDIANRAGTTASQIQQSTADWLRVGESLSEASKSAELSNVLLNVSEFDNIDSATESLVAMSQAYKDVEKIDIIDRLNKIGL